MPDDKLKYLYDNLIGTQKVTTKEIGDFETFSSLMSDTANVSRVYNNLIKNKVVTPNEVGDINQFRQYVSSSFTPKEEPFDYDSALSEIDNKWAETSAIYQATKLKESQPEELSFKERMYQNAQRYAGREMPLTFKIAEDIRPESSEISESESVANQLSYLQSAKDFINIAKNKDQVGTEEGLMSLGKGLISPLGRDFFTAGLGELARNTDFVRVARKQADGQPLTDNEQTLLDAYNILQGELQEPGSITYKIGAGAAEMVPYLAQFALTRGSGSAVQGGVNKLLKVTAKESIRDYVKDVGLRKGAGQILKELPGLAVGAAAQSTIMPMTYSSISDKLVGEQDQQGNFINNPGLSEATVKGFMANYPEVFTEVMGGHIMSSMGMAGRLIGKKSLGGLTKYLSPLQKVKKAAEFGGFLEETSEELLNNVLAPLFDQDVTAKDVWTLENVLTMMGSVALVGGGFYASDLAYKTLDENRLRSKYLSGLPKDVRTNVIGALKADDPKIVSQNLSTIISKSGLQPQQAKGILDYAWAESMRKGMAESLFEQNKEIQTRQIEKEMTNQIAPFAFKDGESLFQVLDNGGNIFWVKDGEINVNPDDGTWTIGNQPLVVVPMEGGEPQMLAATDVSSVRHSRITDKINEQIAQFQQQAEMEKSLMDAAEIADTEKAEAATPDLKTGDVVLYNGRNAVINSVGSTSIDAQYTDTDEPVVIPPEQYSNLQKVEAQPTAQATAPSTAQPEDESKTLTAKVGKNEVKVKFTPDAQDKALFTSDNSFLQESDANRVIKSLSDRYSKLEFTAVDLNTDPFADNKFVIQVKPKTIPATVESEVTKPVTGVTTENVVAPTGGTEPLKPQTKSKWIDEVKKNDLDFLIDDIIEIEEVSDTDFEGTKAGAEYNAETNKIRHKAKAKINTIIHELIHHNLKFKIKPEQLERVRAKARNIMARIEEVASGRGLSGRMFDFIDGYRGLGASPEQEFVTWYLTDKDFNDDIEKLPPPLKKIIESFVREVSGFSESEIQKIRSVALTEGTSSSEISVKSFKFGAGGTKGVFIGGNGQLYKSTQPMELGFDKDNKVQRTPIEGKKTDEYELLSELQDLENVIKIGKIVQTSEGEMFEIEKLTEPGELTYNEYRKIEDTVAEINSRGIEIGDMISVMRRGDTPVIIDLSIAIKKEDADDRMILGDVFNLVSDGGRQRILQENKSKRKETLNKLGVQDLKTKTANQSVSKDETKAKLLNELKDHTMPYQHKVVFKKLIEGIFNIGGSNPIIQDKIGNYNSYNPKVLTDYLNYELGDKYSENQIKNIISYYQDFINHIHTQHKLSLLGEVEGKSGLPDNLKDREISNTYQKFTSDLGLTEPFDQIEGDAKTGKIGDADIVVARDNDRVILESIRVPLKKREKGQANAAMKAITEKADELGLDITLRAVPEVSSDMTAQQLRDWYRKFGFSFVGNNGLRVANEEGVRPQRTEPKSEQPVSATPQEPIKEEIRQQPETPAEKSGESLKEPVVEKPKDEFVGDVVKPAKEPKVKNLDKRKHTQPKRWQEVLKAEPESFEEGVLQFLLSGGRFKTDDFVRYSGFKKGSTEFKIAQLQYLRRDGQPMDTYGDSHNTFGMDEGGAMDMINKIVDIILSHKSKWTVAEKLEELQGVTGLKEEDLVDPELLAQAQAEIENEPEPAEDARSIKERLPNVLAQLVEQYDFPISDVTSVEELINFVEDHADEFTPTSFPYSPQDKIDILKFLNDEKQREPRRNKVEDSQAVSGAETGEKETGRTAKQREIDRIISDYDKRIADLKETLVSDAQLRNRQNEAVKAANKKISLSGQEGSQGEQDMFAGEGAFGTNETEIRKGIADQVAAYNRQVNATIAQLVKDEKVEIKLAEKQIEMDMEVEEKKPDPVKTVQKIEDFGEKIEGARKDQIKKYFDKINLNGRILSVIFPKPDIKQLLESGLSVKDASAIKVAHEFAVADKKRGTEVMKFYASYAKSVLAESINIEFKNERYVFSDYGKSQIILRTQAYEKIAKELGNEYLSLDLTKAKIAEVTENAVKYFAKKPEGKYMVQYYVSARKYFETLDEATDEFVAQIKANTTKDTVTYKHKLGIYRERYGTDHFIAYQPSGKPIIKLQGGFNSAREAYDYKNTHEADLQTELDRILSEQKVDTKRSVTRLKYSNETARERVGKDWRNGKNISSKEFGETFGFRGVEFGNWVNQSERQVFMNNSYDSLMDLAQLLNIPPSAISLGGNLAVSFGSRGSGNAAAHYEPGRKIINLTKTQGLGSLAHEWFHAIDNYFAGFGEGMEHMKAATGGHFTPETRQEIKDAFDKLYKTFHGTEFKIRSRNLDASKSRNYFSLNHEMGARAFENYVLNRLKESGQINDFIVNYISTDDWNGREDMYPYPIGDETAKITEAFNNLFETIQTKEEDGNTILFQLQPSADIFYSNSIKALESIKQEKATPEQWKAMLLNNGAKEAELEWMGWDEFVQGKRSFSKNELSDWMNSQKVEVREVELGDEIDVSDADVLDESFNDFLDNKVTERELNSQDIIIVRDEDGAPHYAAFKRSETKYEQYQLPGGQNYRELLLTMPQKKVTHTYSAKQITRNGRTWWTSVNDVTGEETFTPRNLTEQEAIELAAHETKINAPYPKAVKGETFTSAHFDQPNILAHVRFNERTDADGNRVLFIEEIQSDWAQNGKKEGFGDRKHERDVYFIAQAVYNAKRYADSKERSQELLNGLKERAKKDNVTEDEIAAALQEYGDFTRVPSFVGVPNMPFPKTDQWVGLAMKRMIRWAADNGFDKIAWTTGAQQAERYDLSKQVDVLSYNPETKQLTAYQDRREVLNQKAEPSELEGIVGKEVAKKLLATDDVDINNNKVHTLVGNDLKIGGEGMKAFYDNIIPNWVNKFGKKYGVKVGESKFDIYFTAPDGTEVKHIRNNPTFKTQSFDLTDQLREVAQQGLPLFRIEQNPLQSMKSDFFGDVVFGKKWDEFLQFHANLQKMASRVSEQTGTKIFVVKSAGELPAYLRGAVKRKNDQGNFAPALFYDKNGEKEVWLISNQTRSTSDAGKSLLHEVVAHHGLRQLFGARYDNILRQVWAQMDDDSKIERFRTYLAGNREVFDRMSREDKLKLINNTNESQRFLLADEWLAKQAETLGDKTPTWLQKIFSQIRQMLRDVFGVNLKFTDNDLKAMFAASRANLARQAASKPITGKFAGEVIFDKETLRHAMTLYHGTPHDFDKFSMDKIGTGEGAQSYGYGLYFTDLKDVAKWYADKLGGRNKAQNLYEELDRVFIGNKKWKEISDYYTAYGLHEVVKSGDKQAIEDWFQHEIQLWRDSINDPEYKYHTYAKNQLTKIETAYNAYKKDGIEYRTGKTLITATIHKGKTADQYDYLRWDKVPTDEQLKKVEDAVNKVKQGFKDLGLTLKRDGIMGWFEHSNGEVVSKTGASLIADKKGVPGTDEQMDYIHKWGSKLYSFDNLLKNWEKEKQSGERLYNQISLIFESEKEGSQFLLSAGIDGIKYPAESKGDNARGFNYVVFDENAIEIEDKLRFQLKNKTNANKYDFQKDSGTKIGNNIGRYSQEIIINDRGGTGGLYTETLGRENADVNIRFQIIGEQGAQRLVDAGLAVDSINNLDIAKQMESAGKSEKEIWMATGWQKGKDGKWRMEIPDFKLNPKIADKKKLNAVMDLPELITATDVFKAYPNLKNIVVFLDVKPEQTSPHGGFIPAKGNIGADIIPSEIQVFASSMNEALSIATHEVQHAIQFEEGFSKGSNLENAPRVDMTAIDAIRKQKAALNIDPYRIENQINFGYKVDPETVEKYNQWLELRQREDELLAQIKTPYEAYKRVAGEVEARNAQRRLYYTDAQRAISELSQSEDVAREDQIVLMDRVKNALDLTPEVPQTETEAFKRWFGDSKVVDENGKPLVVYHGTGNDFDTFDINKFATATDGGWFGKGFYFTSDPSVASTYSDNGIQGGDNVMPVYLSLQNPFDFTGKNPRELMDKYGDAEGFTKWAKSQGYDGAIGFHQYVVFDATQVKSATGNIGTFSPDNPDIRFSLQPEEKFFAEETKLLKSLSDEFGKEFGKDFNIIFNESNTTNSSYIKVLTKDYKPLITFRASDHEASFARTYGERVYPLSFDNTERWRDQILSQLEAFRDEAKNSRIALDKIEQLKPGQIVEIDGGKYKVVGANRSYVTVESVNPVTVTLDGLGDNFAEMHNTGMFGAYQANRTKVLKGEPLDDGVKLISSGERGGVKHFTFEKTHKPMRTIKADVLAQKLGYYPQPDNIRFTIQPPPPGLTEPYNPDELQPRDMFNTDNTFETKFNHAVEKVFDSMLAVKFVEDEVERRGGKFNAHSRPYREENMARSRAQAEKEKFDQTLVLPFEKAQADIIMATKGTDNELTARDIWKYLVAKHAPERNRDLGGESGVAAGSIDGMKLTDEYAKWIVDQFENEVNKYDGDLLQKLWDARNKVTRFTLDKYLASGMISREVYDKLTDPANGWQHYVPYRGWKDNLNELFDYQSEGLSDAYNPMKKAEGRLSEADDPTVYMISMGHTAILAGAKNDYKRQMANLILLNPDIADEKDLFWFKRVYRILDDNGNIVDEMPQDQLPGLYIEKRDNGKITVVGSGISGVRAKLKKAGGVWDFARRGYTFEPEREDDLRMEFAIKPGTVTTKVTDIHQSRKPIYLAKQHEVDVWIRGERAIMVFADPKVAHALNRQNFYASSLTQDKHFQMIVGTPTRYLAQVLTSKNPAFWPVNMTRDIGYAWAWHAINSDQDAAQFLKNVPLAIKASHRYLKGHTEHLKQKNIGTLNDVDKMYLRWKEAGGETSYFRLLDVEKIRKNVDHDLKVMMGELSVAGRMNENVIQKAGEWLGIYSQLSENISRFATYMSAYQQYRKKGIEDEEAHKRAVADSKNVTVNFDKYGRVTPLLKAFYLFIGPNLGGVYNMGKLAAKHKKAFAKGILTFMALGLASAEITRLLSPPDDDDPNKKEYDTLNDFVKENYLVLPNPAWWFTDTANESFITIPMPQGFRAFSGIGVLIDDVIHGKKTIGEAAMKASTGIADAFMPVSMNFTSMTEDGLTAQRALRPAIPDVIKPYWDIWVTNEDFAGRMITREPFTKDLERRLPEFVEANRYNNPYIVMASKWLNKLGGGDDLRSATFELGDDGQIRYKGLNRPFDVNPARIEYLIEAYTGGVGMELNNTIKTITRAVEKALGDEDAVVDSRNIPILRRFYRTASNESAFRQFNELKKEVDTHYSFMSSYKREGETDKYRMMKTNPYMRQMKQLVDRVEKRSDNIREIIDWKQQNEESAQKYFEQMEQMYRDALKEAEKIKEQQPK